MTYLRSPKAATALLAAGLLFGPAFTVQAQNADTDTAGIEEVTVTGSYIKRRTMNSPSPISVISQSDIEELGVPTITDIVKNLTINTGSEFNSDAFTQNASTGTAQINLRGLGLQSTLTLVNGRRQVGSGSVGDDGTSFVDINSLMPLIMIDRVEVLKDGAAALYGSDAIAGVVNFITRDDYEGAEVQFDYQTTTEDSQPDISISGIFGAGNDRTHITVAFSYFDRGELSSSKRALTAGTGISTLGQPGSFFLLGRPADGNPFQPVFDVLNSLGLNTVVPVMDPTCGVVGGIPSPIPSVPIPGTGTCNFDFGPFFSLVPKEQRYQGYATARHQLTDDIQLFGEFGFSRNRSQRGNSPSFPVLSFPVIPPNNPGNLFGVPVVFLGRALGANAGSLPSMNNFSTFRGTAGLRANLTETWTAETSVTYSTQDLTFKVGDTLADRFFAAIQGLGGPDCRPENPNNQPGVGDCKFFNPFGSGQATNDPAVIEDFSAFAVNNTRTELLTWDTVVSGITNIQLPGGPIGLAVGGQFRHEEFFTDWSDQYNRENFLFIVGGPDFGDKRDIWAAFGELSLPILDSLEIQAAVRYENHQRGISTVDPKIGILWQPVGGVSVRGSFTTAFRAASVFQQAGKQTILTDIRDGPSRVFRPVITSGDPNLKPENADVYNFGASWAPPQLKGLTLSIDYWRFEYSRIIVKPSAQGVVNAENASGIPDPRIIRGPNGSITRILLDFFNAASLNTDGLDFSGGYSWDMDKWGFFRFQGDATHVTSFQIREVAGGPVINGAGSRNATNFARSVPTWRANFTLAWALGNHSANAIVRVINSYTDDQNNVPIDAHVTLDLQYSYQLPAFFDADEGTRLTVGAINVLNNEVPRVQTNGGFDPKVHDPRGRLVYVKVKQPF